MLFRRYVYTLELSADLSKIIKKAPVKPLRPDGGFIDWYLAQVQFALYALVIENFVVLCRSSKLFRERTLVRLESTRVQFSCVQIAGLSTELSAGCWKPAALAASNVMPPSRWSDLAMFRYYK